MALLLSVVMVKPIPQRVKPVMMRVKVPLVMQTVVLLSVVMVKPT